jgi:O-acetyl-ADP-ribose deacetylase (regulator of RNase III)
MQFTVVQGDIAAQEADALVNAAGTSLEMGSGVAGALRRGAGPELNEEATSKGPVELGEAAVTDAYDLDAEYVIHAAAMPHYGVHENGSSREHAGPEGSGNDGKATVESIRSGTRNALAAADERGCESLVIPALGCGVAGFDLAEGARIICEEIRGFEPESLADVRFIAYADDEYETVRRVAEDVRDTSP